MKHLIPRAIIATLLSTLAMFIYAMKLIFLSISGELSFENDNFEITCFIVIWIFGFMLAPIILRYIKIK